MEYFPRSNSRIRSGSTRDCFSTARAPFTGFNMKIMLINGRNSLRLELFLFPCHASIARNLFKRFSQGHRNWNRKARIADKFLGSSHKYEANLHPWDYVACWKLFARSFNEKPLSVRMDQRLWIYDDIAGCSFNGFLSRMIYLAAVSRPSTIFADNSYRTFGRKYFCDKIHACNQKLHNR